MAAITGDFPPGPYEMTYKGTSVGMMEGPIRGQDQHIAAAIRASLYGQTIIDWINQGMASFVAFTVKEWNAGAKAAMWQAGDAPGQCVEAGVLMNTRAGALVLTALAGTPAATEGPVTRTYALAMLLPGHNVDVTFGPEERNVAIVMVALPEPLTTGSKKTKTYADT
jgi:hypothetical protein